MVLDCITFHHYANLSLVDLHALHGNQIVITTGITDVNNDTMLTAYIIPYSALKE